MERKCHIALEACQIKHDADRIRVILACPHLFQDPVVHGKRVLVQRGIQSGIDQVEHQPVGILEFAGLKPHGPVLIDHDAGIGAAGPMPDARYTPQALQLSEQLCGAPARDGVRFLLP